MGFDPRCTGQQLGGLWCPCPSRLVSRVEAGGVLGANLIPPPHPQDSELLTFNLSRHRSWWREHGPGCQREEPVVGLGPPNGQALGPGVTCALEHGYVEALHSALQILVAVSVGEGEGHRGGDSSAVEQTGGPGPRTFVHEGPHRPPPAQGALFCPTSA